VSPRTFNNYFSSKEAAIVFPTTLRAGRLAEDLAEQPADEPLEAWSGRRLPPPCSRSSC
jgi:AcrR family transcriptional regulator